MATVPARQYVTASRILLILALILFLVGFCMGVGFLFDKQSVEDILGVISLGLAFTALALIA